MDINAAVNDLMCQCIEWPPARKMKADAFIDLVMPASRCRLRDYNRYCTGTDAADIAAAGADCGRIKSVFHRIGSAGRKAVTLTACPCANQQDKPIWLSESAVLRETLISGIFFWTASG
jgi:hypothetical protein